MNPANLSVEGSSDSEPSLTPMVEIEEDRTLSTVPWFEGEFAQALESADSAGAWVMVDVGASWCEPCRDLEQAVFADTSVGAALSTGFVPIRIDADEGEGPQIVDRYHVQVYPTVLVLDGAGVERGRLVEFDGPQHFIAALATASDGGDVLATLAAEVSKNPSDLANIYALGLRYAHAARRDRAEELFAQVIAKDENNRAGLAAKALLDRAVFIDFKIDRDGDAAIAAMRSLQGRFPNSEPAVKAFRQIGRVLNSQGKPEQAIRQLETMIDVRPDDVDLLESYGWFSFRERCHPEAGLRAVQRGIHLAPTRAGLHALAAQLHHLLGENAEAELSASRALELEPKSAYYARQRLRFSGRVQETKQ